MLQCRKFSSIRAVLYTFVLQKGGANVILLDNPAIIQGAGIEPLFLNQLSLARGTVAEFLDTPFITMCGAVVLNLELRVFRFR
ncbi:hypothetical protein WN50_02565 [Limnoraphis robusta CS-951]|uniref:Uncharacterized protein n=1 Tax=Limnoraphis robusta CS-951 TaxID=1637645 RepID=A0A0F5YL42_9CYAN|nr:hypothetical protein WN50_02565 [Limnoraphis robusta CS-951]